MHLEQHRDVARGVQFPRHTTECDSGSTGSRSLGGNTMDDPRVSNLFAQARQGRISRRDLLETGLRLGLATPVIMALMSAAPDVSAAPAPSTARRLPRPQDGSGGTFTYIRDGSAPDL